MAKSRAVWGIDLGQCALKAIRLSPGEEPGQVFADAFDYVEYPKILSQPEAEPAELIKEALETFLSRNSVRGDRVAISVAGQNGLARFIKLPPVESKKIPDIVKYEARQQIPFALEDVVWDYQQMAGGSEEEGFALETEVGLFAMKRDQVARALAPFDNAGIEVHFVQLTPLALYNCVAFDRMQDLPEPDEYDPDNPPPSIVVLSLGTDTADLVVTNGFRVWQRNIPIGGSHFTKALTKELKLTFAKAEHLKRNARQAEDPKAVFQAMRPVFNDLLTEVQRSISYFSSVDKDAKIERILALGNAMKLPGLQRYLTQHLGQEVERFDNFQQMAGPEVIAAPAFKENILSFPTAYGLALQGVAETKIHTNLVPPEVTTERMIREKKPWTIAAAAVLLLGLTVNLVGHWRAWSTAHNEEFDSAMSTATRVKRESDSFKNDFRRLETDFKSTNDIGQHLVHNVDGRYLWMEVLKAIEVCLPSDGDDPPDNPAERNRIYVRDVYCDYTPNIAGWFTNVAQYYRAPEEPPAPDSEAGEEGAPSPAPSRAMAANTPKPPSEGGWIFQLECHHFHNGTIGDEGREYVHKTLIKNLHEKVITTEDGQEIPVGKLGIGLPVILPTGRIGPPTEIPDPREVAVEGEEQPTITLQRFDFTVQFYWQETLPAERETEEEASGQVASN